jgi:hypothetical protein
VVCHNVGSICIERPALSILSDGSSGRISGIQRRDAKCVRAVTPLQVLLIEESYRDGETLTAGAA